MTISEHFKNSRHRNHVEEILHNDEKLSYTVAQKTPSPQTIFAITYQIRKDMATKMCTHKFKPTLLAFVTPALI